MWYLRAWNQFEVPANPSATTIPAAWPNDPSFEVTNTHLVGREGCTGWPTAHIGCGAAVLLTVQKWVFLTSTLRRPSPWRRNQVSCLTAVHRGVQAQIKRWLVWKHFYFPIEERFSGISPSRFASVVSINAYIIADILQDECKVC